MTEAFTGDVVLLRRNKALIGLAASPLLVAFASTVAAVAVDPRWASLAFLGVLMAMLALALVFIVNPWRKSEPAHLQADHEGLRASTGMSIPRADIKEALVVPGRGKGTTVAFSCRGRLGFDVGVRDEGEGRKLLTAMGLDASHAIVSFLGMSRVYASMRNFFLNMGVMFAGPALFGALGGFLHAPLFTIPAVLAFVGAYISFFMPGRIKVGADGVVVSWYGSKRFVGYGDVEVMTAYARDFGTSQIRGVSLVLKSGEEIRVPLGYGYWDSGRSSIVAERIEEAMEMYRRGAGGADVAMLGRTHRNVTEWILALRQMGSGGSAGPRTAAVAPDMLWRIVEDPSSASAKRAAAAVALGSGLDGDGRARLRAVAEATAAPKLRVAIEAASGSDDEALAGALDELERAEAEAKTGRS